MMKKILVATDFSNSAYNALFFTTELFKKRQCKFFLLNTFTERTEIITQKIGSEGSRSLIDQLSDESVEGLNQMFHRIHLDQENPLHDFKILSKNENLVDGLEQAIENYQIDLLVMGNKGHTAARNILWGSSVSKAIADIDNCPILIIPEEYEYSSPKEIAFATDYKRSFDAQLLNPIIRIAELSEAKVRIMHIDEEDRLNEVQKSNLYTLREYFNNIEHSIHWMPDFSYKSRVIKTFVEEQDIDFLAMVHYQYGFLSQLLREPVLKKISFNIDIPFLVLPYSK